MPSRPSSPRRLAARFVFLFALAGLLFALPAFHEDTPPYGSGFELESAADCDLYSQPTNLAKRVKRCAKCHADVHEEWSGSPHSQSWSNPVFQASIKDLGEKEREGCARCHAPGSIIETGYGKIPEAREHDRDVGVNCFTCHVLGNRYFGPHQSKGHGGIKATKEFTEATLCLSCHGQPEARADHDQGSSYLAGPVSKRTSCQECHMPGTRRKMVTNKKIKPKFLRGVVDARIHGFYGARSGKVLPGCAELDLEFEDEGLVAVVTARTGHSFPASSGRLVILEITQYDAKGKALKVDSREWSFPEKGKALAPEKPVATSVEVLEETVTAKARLVHRVLAVPGRPKAIDHDVATAEAEAPGK